VECVNVHALQPTGCPNPCLMCQSAVVRCALVVLVLVGWECVDQAACSLSLFCRPPGAHMFPDKHTGYAPTKWSKWQCLGRGTQPIEVLDVRNAQLAWWIFLDVCTRHGDQLFGLAGAGMQWSVIWGCASIWLLLCYKRCENEKPVCTRDMTLRRPMSYSKLCSNGQSIFCLRTKEGGLYADCHRIAINVAEELAIQLLFAECRTNICFGLRWIELAWPLWVPSWIAMGCKWLIPIYIPYMWSEIACLND